MCQRFSAAVFIQKVYRGYRERRKVRSLRLKEVKQKIDHKRSCKLLSTVLGQVFDRAKHANHLQQAFFRIRQKYWLNLHEGHLAQIRLIQSAFHSILKQ